MFGSRAAHGERSTTRNEPGSEARVTARFGACSLLGLVLGCGSSPPATIPATETRAPAAAKLDTTAQTNEPTLLHKASQAPTRELALGELGRELATFLVGPQWAPMLERAAWGSVDWPTWLVDNQVVYREPSTGRYAATLTRTRAQQVLNEFASAALPVAHLALPTAWQTTVFPALGAEREWVLCQRKQELLGVPCEQTMPLDARLSVAALFSNLALQPLLLDGIPVRENGEAAWSFDVRIVSQSNGQVTALAGLPVEFTQPEGPATPAAATTANANIGANQLNDAKSLVSPPRHATLTQSDEQGLARFSFTPSDKPLRVHIALNSMLGPLSTLVEAPELRAHTRALQLARLTVVEANESASSPPGSLGAALTRELALAYGKPLPSLSTELTRRLTSTIALAPTGTTVLPAALCRDVVESTRGVVDYLVLVTGDAEFASQMGADRTWYQARARAAVVEVWSGQVQTTFDERATGSGFGDQAAAQAAQGAVARGLRTKLETWRGP